MKVKELRLILTVDNLDEVIKFYKETIGFAVSKEWHEPAGNGIILDAGRASLELIDNKHAERIDKIEVGQRVSGKVRIALNVGEEIEKVGKELEALGAIKIADVKQAPWSKVQRMQDPGGMQFTLFETSTLFSEQVSP